MAMGQMAMSRESETSLTAFQALNAVCGRAQRTDAVLAYEIEKFTAARDEAVQIARAWMIILLIQSTEIHAWIHAFISDEKVFPRILGMLRSKSYPVKASAAHLLAYLGSNDDVLIAMSKDEHIDLLLESLNNDPLEWTDGVLRVFEAFSRRKKFLQKLSGTHMVVRLRGMLRSSTPAPKMAGKLLGFFSEKREFELIVLGILPQLEVMLLQSYQSESQAMASRLLVDVSRYKMRSETLTKSIIQIFVNILQKILQSETYSFPIYEVADALEEIIQYEEFKPVTSRIIRQLITGLKSGAGGRYGTFNHGKILIEITVKLFIEMLKHKEVRSTILQTHGGIFQVLTNIRQSISQKIVACTLLAEISQHEEFRPAILNADVMPFLSSMLHSGEEKLEEEAAITLSIFLLNDELRLAIIPTESYPRLLAVLQKIARRKGVAKK